MSAWEKLGEVGVDTSGCGAIEGEAKGLGGGEDDDGGEDGVTHDRAPQPISILVSRTHHPFLWAFQ